jgi:hypothetical protein
MGCFHSDNTIRTKKIAAGTRVFLGNLGEVYPQHSEEWLHASEKACAGYSYVGLSWQNECFCDNNYGAAIGELPTMVSSQPAPCGDEGVNCGRDDGRPAVGG